MSSKNSLEIVGEFIEGQRRYDLIMKYGSRLVFLCENEVQCYSFFSQIFICTHVNKIDSDTFQVMNTHFLQKYGVLAGSRP